MINHVVASLKKLLLFLVNHAGYRVEKIIDKSEINHYSTYSKIVSHATYSPWLADQEFQEVFAAIKQNTLVDELRCYELWQLVAQTAKLTGALLEVGVWRGGTAALIAYRAHKQGIQDTVYLCDTFEGVVKAGERDLFYKGGEHSDTSQSLVEELLYDKLQLTNCKILKGIFPEETSEFIPADCKFRFCHIDVDVYQSAKDIVRWVWNKIEIGGCIVFDDYGFEGCTGITNLIDNEERLKQDRIILTNLNGHAIIIKIR